MIKVIGQTISENNIIGDHRGIQSFEIYIRFYHFV